MLHHCSASPDVVFGASFSGRPPDLPGVSTLVGPCVTNLPVRVRFEAGSSLRELLQGVHRNLSGLATHQYSSPEEIQSQSAVPWRHRVFESPWCSRTTSSTCRRAAVCDGVRCRVAHAPESTSYGLTLAVTPGEALRIRMLPASGAIDAQSLQAYAQALSSVLASMTALPRTRACRESWQRCPRRCAAVRRGCPRRARLRAPGVPARRPRRRCSAWWLRSGASCSADDLSVDENFFELGGQSLLLMQAHRRLAERLQRDLPIVLLLQYPTIRTLAQALDGAPAARDMAAEIAARARRQLEARKPPTLPRKGG
ncbi:MAG: hypothetical protein IPM70_00080 [Proteobacteria bacterium]|nr:hypothetical protein [Pseudomonadota bacterium]